MINIEYTIDLKVDNSGWEPVKSPAGQVYTKINGDLVNTYISHGLLSDDVAEINIGDYTPIDSDYWLTERSKLTKGKVRNFKIKNITGVGPIGMYVNEKDETVIKIPIETPGVLPTLDNIVIEDDEEFINYEINNDMSFYENVRLIFKQGDLTHEFIVNENNGSIPKPFDMEGQFTLTAIGYNDNIREFSNESEGLDVTITSRP